VTATPHRAGAAFEAERVALADLATHRGAWADLIARALEPNVFLEPDFVLPVAAAVPARRRPSFVLVWSVSASADRSLVALCPLAPARALVPGWISLWSHDFAPLGGPLLDRDRADAALAALVETLAGAQPGAAALVLRGLAADGPGFSTIEALAEATGRPFEAVTTWNRAVLREAALAGRSMPSKRRQKELARQRRRLAEQGPLTYARYEHGPAFAAVVESFLDLESKGWKGARGTALRSRPAQADFARRMLQALAAAGQCRIDALLLGQAPVAMGILLSSSGHDFFWKMAYAEDLARLSPGVQFVTELTAAQHARTGICLTDSCAIPDHPMIDRLWPDRRPIADMVLGLRPGHRQFVFRLILAALRARLGLKAGLKRLLATLRPGRRVW
jgi:CelD/BcsL family acetyltransferase involved in cellulose biosynthesis